MEKKRQALTHSSKRLIPVLHSGWPSTGKGWNGAARRLGQAETKSPIYYGRAAFSLQFVPFLPKAGCSREGALAT